MPFMSEHKICIKKNKSMTRNISIKEEKTLSDNFFPLKTFTYEMEKEDGTKEELTREVYMSANGATVLLYNQAKGKVVLTRQFRLPTYLNNNPTGMMLETCAGIVEDDENPNESIIREIKEETGYKLEKATKVFDLYSTPGSVCEKIYYYVAGYNSKEKASEGGGLEEEQEEIEVIEMPFEEAYLKIQTGEIKDAKTVLLLQYARINIFPEEKVFNIL
jgi:GDP-mannose pyrophosphatase NudK